MSASALLSGGWIGLTGLKICVVDTSAFAAANANGYWKVHVISKRLSSAVAFSVIFEIRTRQMDRESLIVGHVHSFLPENNKKWSRPCKYTIAG